MTYLFCSKFDDLPEIAAPNSELEWNHSDNKNRVVEYGIPEEEISKINKKTTLKMINALKIELESL